MPSSFSISHNTRKILWWSLGLALIARLICNAVIPLTDTTEARYGEIARKMLETGDWITPQHDYGVPFWAKPPLSTWLSAFSMKIFGVNEFAARFPSVLLGIGILMLVWQWTKTQRNRDFALTVCAVLASMSLFFVSSGAVMTDESLVLCTTLAMIAFWRAINNEYETGSTKLWGYLFFVALGFGILAKGLLVGALVFLPIVPWVILHRNKPAARGHWRSVWRTLPWLRGSVLMLAISLPWYIAAEHKTPGFLAYFILGEHFGRFLHSGWNGDKYGNAHAEALGMIWLFLIMAALPWSFIAIAKLKGFWKASLKNTDDDGWLLYLLMWSLVPIAFFTFAHNIIWTYPLPTLPALAVLIVELLQRTNIRNFDIQNFDIRNSDTARTNTGNSNTGHSMSPRLAAASFVTPIVLLILAALYADGHHEFLKSSQKDSAAFYMQNRPSSNSGLYYFRHRYYSSEFYSGGKAKAIEAEDTAALINNDRTDYLVIRRGDLDQLPAPVRNHFESSATFGNFVVLRETPTAPLVSQRTPLTAKAPL
ncbi:MAG: glycosyltransferase family 39 protein [Spongiibacteraceae bacterium]